MYPCTRAHMCVIREACKKLENFLNTLCTRRTFIKIDSLPVYHWSIFIDRKIYGWTIIKSKFYLFFFQKYNTRRWIYHLYYEVYIWDRARAVIGRSLIVCFRIAAGEIIYKTIKTLLIIYIFTVQKYVYYDTYLFIVLNYVLK